MSRPSLSILAVVLVILSLGAVVACGGEKTYNAWIIEPGNNVKGPSPVVVSVGLEREFAEAADGQAIRPDHGYHVLVIDDEIPAPGVRVPEDERHIHLIQEQRESGTEFKKPGGEGNFREMLMVYTQLDLDAGEHTVTTVFVDQNGVPFEPPMNNTIGITVTSRRVVSFVEPQDGATVKSPFTVKMGADGVVVEPAGEIRDGWGHHHIVIDAELPDPRRPFPDDEQHIHYAAGETETTISLPPGEHTLRLMFAYGIEIPYGPPVLTDSITITVE